MSIDAAGSLYIGDSGLTPEWYDVEKTEGNRVRRIDASTGIITTIAGDGVNGFGGDGGAATAAMISVPIGFTVDQPGSFLFIDSGNNSVRRIDAATGIITTVAGGGVRHFAVDGGPPAAAGLHRSGFA